MTTAQRRRRAEVPQQDVARAAMLALLYTGDDLSSPCYDGGLAIEICRTLAPAKKERLLKFVFGVPDPPASSATQILESAFNTYNRERKEAHAT